MAPAMDVEDDDPVVAEYDVYITPDVAEQQLYVLQYLNRPPDQPFTKATESQPTELRIKKDSGFIEVDVPINIHRNYNRLAGVRWGEAMRKTKGFGQKAFGIASGFERTMPRSGNRPGAAGEGAPVAPVTAEDDDNIEEYVTHFEDANEKGHVLNTQTFGGQILHEDGKGPSYMLGTFRDNELHLTRIDGLVQLRTQFHHIDASAQLEAVQRRREKESQEGAKLAEPKAFLAQVKKTGGDTAAELTQAFMKATNQEQWQRLNYFDENDERAFESYHERLFIQDVASAPKLQAKIDNSGFLDTISTSGKGGKKKSRRSIQDLVEISDESDEDEEEKETTEAKES
ncbi:DNA-directed RNA polymerase III subunit Rpc5 [Bipolaris maydis]|uniref:DNA-directed RNA polymerase III subunit Rpc5 n=1 Tax=Cochliobolus heterostrophus TaxID=5016 RepID=UPI0024DB7FE1|nr:DNA-directed RNA polymerase III subunit Rpc5 [Bipolaris maydis]KAJ5041359.1 DNA-directed RNA polymerase III subunit Rpc5 [Bipolaris maydis]KAJ5065271.1 DNA-directed RNA polymerase III subunit Rpc5 [Bipolaris maydis]KAJ6200483.1 DNA-directed RNA polymerase III subunit Rpc5 [Bipolaris maydis]KAJ6274895.1 DNA-directed RNA polymerase III subunit Rpc5 [Bipolaris maydis]